MVLPWFSHIIEIWHSQGASLWHSLTAKEGRIWSLSGFSQTIHPWRIFIARATVRTTPLVILTMIGVDVTCSTTKSRLSVMVEMQSFQAERNSLGDWGIALLYSVMSCLLSTGRRSYLQYCAPIVRTLRVKTTIRRALEGLLLGLIVILGWLRARKHSVVVGGRNNITETSFKGLRIVPWSTPSLFFWARVCSFKEQYWWDCRFLANVV